MIVSFQKPQPSRLSRVEFKAIVARMVEAGSFAVARHLKRDHPERRISHAQIAACLTKGTVQTDPFVNSHGNFQAEVFRHIAGEPLTVVAAIEWEKQVIVVTAY
jgi:hypothetical protein